MPKKKTTIIIDESLWIQLVKFATEKHGSAKKISVEIEEAVREYLDRHSKEGRSRS